MRYLDGWLLVQDYVLLICRRDQLLLLCDDLGIQINLGKSDLIPFRRKVYLGMLLDTTIGAVFPTANRINRLLKVARPFLNRDWLPALAWLSLLGHLSSLEKLVPGGRSRMRNLQFRLNDCWSADSGDTRALVPMSSECKADLVWWLQEENLLRGSPEVLLFTDASKSGWGAHLLDEDTSGLWP